MCAVLVAYSAAVCQSTTTRSTVSRLLEPIGNIPPIEFEIAYYQQIEESADTAYSNQIVSGKVGAIHI